MNRIGQPCRPHRKKEQHAGRDLRTRQDGRRDGPTRRAWRSRRRRLEPDRGMSPEIAAEPENEGRITVAEPIERIVEMM